MNSDKLVVKVCELNLAFKNTFTSSTEVLFFGSD